MALYLFQELNWLLPHSKLTYDYVHDLIIELRLFFYEHNQIDTIRYYSGMFYLTWRKAIFLDML